MKITISNTKSELGEKAAITGARIIREAIQTNGVANIIVATGASQFEMLNELIKQDVDWSRVTAFHLDEYIGIPETHPASFRKYLKERFTTKLSLREFHYVDGETDPDMKKYGVLIKKILRNMAEIIQIKKCFVM